jgi:hypothetical protein
MLETLREWLNGKRDYITGVAIYSQVGDNGGLLALFKKGSNEFRERRLVEELLLICTALKSQQNGKSILPGTCMDKGAAGNNKSTGKPKSDNGDGKEATIRATGTGKADKNKDGSSILDRTASDSDLAVNPDLYNACKAEADKNYKEVMNMRAVLFAMAPADDFSDANTPEKINNRTKLALDVVQGFQKISQLYDRADYVKLHGRLPDQDPGEENEYDHLSDHLVFAKLNNARKALSKLKKHEPTAERIALMQKHKSIIEKLEPKWLLLKPQ